MESEPKNIDPGRAATRSLSSRLQHFSWLLALLWTGCIAGSLLWNLYAERERTLTLAHNSAQVTFDNDVLYRRWSAKQGGVYVPVSEHTPPNPYLKVPNRDVTTTSGLSLTLVNPAYMARQVNQLAEGSRGSQAHITSLRPLRPENSPDAWEAAALRAFESGTKEVSSVEKMGEEEYVRLMRPFVTEKACLKCHAAQGYKEGDLRGGISVSVPLAPLWAIEKTHVAETSLAHFGLWLLGVVGILISNNHLAKQVLAREGAEQALRNARDELELRVQQRTAELKTTTDVLGAERQRFNDVLEMMPVYVVLLTPDYHVPFANRFFEERFGKANGQRCFEYLFQRSEPCENCETFKVLQTRVPHHWEWTGPDGRHYDIYDFPFTDTDGSPLIMEVGIDITERKQAEAALRQSNETLEQRVAERTAALAASEEQFRRAIQDAPIPVIMHAEDGEVLQISRTWTELTGYTLADVPTLDVWLNQAYGEGADAVRDHVRELFQGRKRRIGIEFPIRTLEGQVRYWSFNTSSPGKLQDGRRFLVGMALDITERKRAEEVLRQTADDLRRSNSDLEQFAYVSSHDLQEPLRMVGGFLQLLQQKYADQLDAQAGHYIEFAVDGAKRMQTLINDLLAYSRVGTRGQEPAPTDSGRALRHALANLQTSMEESGAEITCGELPTVLADETQIVQLFQNLIGNAVKFRGEAPPKIHVEAQRQDDRWVFSVRDNGIGINPEFRERIFLIFQRLHGRKQYAGTGIGLAICKKIVDRHGGQIWVESQPDQGAAFCFTLPA